MTTAFSPAELIKIAIGIERSASTFFDIMARTTDAELTKEVFEEFVRMEHEHLNTFQDLLSEIGHDPAQPTINPESSGYIQALIDDAVFTNDAVISEAVAQSDSDIKALEVGIGAEKDSILFYQALKEFMPPRAVPALEQIISGEKSHLQQLTAIKKQLQNNG